MKQLSRVVWSEGMYLGPHHFQLQNRYFEDSIQFATGNLWFAPHGLIGCKLDVEALGNGMVALVHARGMLPDGLPFHVPDSDPAPQPRQVADFYPRSGDGVKVFLGVPVRRQDGLNCLLPGTSGADARFSAESEVLHDETTGRDEKPVYVGRKNLRILFETEDLSGWVTLPIGRVVREGSGKYAYDHEFIPPCVNLAASERLMTLLKRLIDILEEKSGGFKQRGSTWVETASREIGYFWLIHTVHAALAPLRHLLFTKRGHPEELYMEMLRLGGALCTFAIDSHPRHLPLYDHNALGDCFGKLDYHIRSHLEIIIPSQYVRIPLQKRANYFYEADITDQRVLDRSRWVFGVYSAKVGEAEVINYTPRLVKLCSKEFIPRLVNQALPGLTLEHLKTPPSAIPAKVDYQYFLVSKQGPCWEHMVKTRKLGLYVPGEIPDPELELLVVLDQ
jgi:type VI secretion system protein ImpJ